jgi:cytochrome c-type biogenesis protein
LSVIFYALSWSAGSLAAVFAEQRTAIRWLGAALVAVMGAFLLGLVRPGLLLREHRWLRPLSGAGWFGSFAAGMGFAAGWSPCIGPTLSLIVALSASDPGRWLALTTGYAVGFSLPFLLLSGFAGASRRLLPYMGAVQKVGGLLLLATAGLLATDRLGVLSDWLSRAVK